jgi:DNA-binding XRE family transcriptional regulator
MHFSCRALRVARRTCDEAFMSADELSPAQCRAARGLLDWTRAELSEAAGVSERALANFESGDVKPIRATRKAIRQAFEAEGVEFGGDGWLRLGTVGK